MCASAALLALALLAVGAAGHVSASPADRHLQFFNLFGSDCSPSIGFHCSKEYRPVCAAGKTYANRCYAEADCQADAKDCTAAELEAAAKLKPTPATTLPAAMSGSGPVAECRACIGDGYAWQADACQSRPVSDSDQYKYCAVQDIECVTTLTGCEYLYNVEGTPAAGKKASRGLPSGSGGGPQCGDLRCVKLYAPVCAGGKTYSNGCTAAEACATQWTDGACEEQLGPLGTLPPPGRESTVPGLLPPPESSTECGGGQVWSECGSKCTRTCETPPIMPCVLMCVARCECPASAPVWDGSACIAAEECPAGAARGGGWSELSPAELATGSRAEQLARFGLETLQTVVCPASAPYRYSSPGCRALQGATFTSLISAKSQVVAGENLQVVAETSAGELSLSFFSQPWTNTLELTKAELENDVLTEAVALDVSRLWAEAAPRRRRQAPRTAAALCVAFVLAAAALARAARTPRWPEPAGGGEAEMRSELI